jgi:hypothetical protein
VSPPLSGAQRNTGAGPPARRYRWRCPTCGAHGFAQNSHAAYLAGTRHFEDEHDPVPTDRRHPA